jgi:SnoaL-like protein
MNTSPTADTAIAAAERIHHEWDEALGAKDVNAALRLYAEDATLESPLVCHLLEQDGGIVTGRENLRSFIELVFQRTPPLRQRYRRHHFTDGKMLTWEYPRATPGGEQMDLVEVMEIHDGLIQHHRVYWGWRALQVLQRDEYRK